MSLMHHVTLSLASGSSGGACRIAESQGGAASLNASVTVWQAPLTLLRLRLPRARPSSGSHRRVHPQAVSLACQKTVWTVAVKEAILVGWQSVLASRLVSSSTFEAF